MYLSQLFLNPRLRQVQRELSDAYQMHRTIMSAFPETLPADERVLYRVDTDLDNQIIKLLVQSQYKPDWSRLASTESHYLLPNEESSDSLPNPAVKEISLHPKPGQRLTFRLLANPTAKRSFEQDGEKKKKRIGLYREEDQLDWLSRKLAEAGCRLVSARTSSQGQASGALYREKTKHKLQFLAVRFDGLLLVEDTGSLLEAVKSGIGSAKGLGFGLLSLAPFRG
jgi:CRISPR system Cascade subunit CasE